MSSAASRAFLRAFRMQLVGERLPSFLLSFAISPIVAIIYVLMARGAGRPDLEVFVVLSPMAVGLWGTVSARATARSRSSADDLDHVCCGHVRKR